MVFLWSYHVISNIPTYVDHHHASNPSPRVFVEPVEVQLSRGDAGSASQSLNDALSLYRELKQKAIAELVAWALEGTWPWVKTYGTIFGWMNIHLPSILMFTRGKGF